MPGRSFPPIPDNLGQWCSNAFTNVCSGWPAPGCTVIPAALLMTIRSSSSYKIVSGIASGSVWIFSGGGSVTSISSPDRIDWWGRVVAPPTRTNPARINCWMRERENCGSELAKKRSSRIRAHSFGTTNLNVIGSSLVAFKAATAILLPPNSSMLQSISMSIKGPLS